jgi:hypothetical protein
LRLKTSYALVIGLSLMITRSNFNELISSKTVFLRTTTDFSHRAISDIALLAMKYTTGRLPELQKQLKHVVKEVEAGKINAADAADRITAIKEEMERVISNLKAKK